MLIDDYRRAQLPETGGATLFIGNPPYVRHHMIAAEWKRWLTREAKALGFEASQLAGLHAHFFLATLRHARQGDYGAFITASEWLDVNYGAFVRDMLTRSLHMRSVTIVDPRARPFPDATTTAAITTFEVGDSRPHVSFRKISDLGRLGSLEDGLPVHRRQLAATSRWSQFTDTRRDVPAGYVELGELCRVHRGQVTGANSIWIAGPHSTSLPASVLKPTITRAREVIEAGDVLKDTARLRNVIDLPRDLDMFDSEERRAIERFVRYAQSQRTHEGYVARNRKVWWAINLYEPAPIVSTYMARRPPAFTLNEARARLLNIAHGLYPRAALSPLALKTLRDYLASSVHVGEGRTYAGGLVKFEPREMERVMVPGIEMLSAGVTIG